MITCPIGYFDNKWPSLSRLPQTLSATVPRLTWQPNGRGPRLPAQLHRLTQARLLLPLPWDSQCLAQTPQERVLL